MQNLDNFLETFTKSHLLGRVVRVSGTSVVAEVDGCSLGSIAKVGSSRAIVTGFEENKAVLALLDEPETLSNTTTAKVLSESSEISVHDSMRGEVVDPLGEVLSESSSSFDLNSEKLPLSGPKKSFLDRNTNYNFVKTGVGAIDLFTPLATGQRIALFAEPGVGKSTLTSMIARNSDADVRVIALIGERAREAKEFIEELKATSAMQNTIFVVSTSADSALKRSLAADTAFTVAEYFVQKGKSVLLQLDSLTRLFRAYREIGLGAGEPGVRRGYPPSAFSKLPKLIERAGSFGDGSITAIFTVLMSGEIDEDPLVDEVKGLLDGHIYLRSSLAEKGVYPAVDVVKSISRLAGKVASPAHQEVARKLKRAVAVARENEELVLYGGEGTPEIKRAMQVSSALEELLMQQSDQSCPLESLLSKAFDVARL